MKKQDVIILTKEQRENFEHFLNLCDYYKNCYFWNGKDSRIHEQDDFIMYHTTVNGIKYSIYFFVSTSRKYVYIDKCVKRDGEKTTARVIRTLLEKDTSVLAS